MRVRLVIGAAFVAVAAAGVWLWSRYGLAVWLEAAIAFCT